MIPFEKYALIDEAKYAGFSPILAKWLKAIREATPETLGEWDYHHELLTTVGLLLDGLKEEDVDRIFDLFEDLRTWGLGQVAFLQLGFMMQKVTNTNFPSQRKWESIEKLRELIKPYQDLKAWFLIEEPQWKDNSPAGE